MKTKPILWPVALLGYLCLLMAQLNAQSTVLPLFEETVGTPGDEFSGWTYYDDDNQGYYQLGSTGGLASLTFLDISGNPIWTRTYDAVAYFRYMTKAPNGDLIMMGDKYYPGGFREIYVSRTQPNGQLVWTNAYTLTGRMIANEIIPSENDSYLIKAWNSPSGSTDDRLALFRIDGQGNIIWSLSQDSGDFQVNGIAPDGLGGCFYGGSIAVNGDPFLGRIDKNGNQVWLKNFPTRDGYTINTLKLSSSGDRILIGGQIFSQNGPVLFDAYAALADTLGNIIWAQRFPTTPVNGSNTAGPFTQVFEGADGKFYVVTRLKDGNIFLPAIARLDFSGNLEKYVAFPQPVESWLVRMTGTNPERIIISRNRNVPGLGADNYLAVMDSSLDFCYQQGSLPAPVSFSFPGSNWSVPLGSLPLNVTSYSQFGTTQFTSSQLCTSCFFEVPEDSLVCSQIDGCSSGNPKVCIPLVAKYSLPSGVIGMDYTLNYDPNFMQPTGQVTLGNVVTASSPAANYSINTLTNPGEVNVSVFYTGQAPPSAEFQGPGEVACVEFELLQGYQSGLTLPISVTDLLQSYAVGYDTACVTPGSFTLLDDSILNGQVLYWNDSNRPLRFSTTTPNLYNITHIQAGNGQCQPLGPLTATDTFGNFSITTPLNGEVLLNRDIAGDTTIPCPVSVMPTINSMDAYWTSLVTTQNNSWVPNAFQIIAMDVNMDGSVTASDITLMQDRIVGNICEYPQAWNQTSNSLGKDWRFVDAQELTNNPGYTVSGNYPGPDNMGYQRLNVPDPSFCLPVPTTSNSFCTTIDSMTYHAILLGDVNGTWTGQPPVATNLKVDGAESISILYEEIVPQENCKALVPIKINCDGSLVGFDFFLDLSESVRIEELKLPASSSIQMAWKQHESGTLSVTGYSTAGGENSSVVLTALIAIHPGTFDVSEATSSGWINGNSVPIIAGDVFDCAGMATNSGEITEAIEHLTIYPNPFTDEIIVDCRRLKDVPKEGLIMNLQGAVVKRFAITSGDVEHVKLDTLPDGVYFVKIGEWTKKVVKQ